MAHVLTMDNGVPVPADREEDDDDAGNRTET
jgi:hypothetical protein